MKSWIKFLILLVICIVVVSIVYVWRFGWPKFLNSGNSYMEKLSKNIFTDSEGITHKLDENKIVFTKELVNLDGENQNETIEFVLEKGVIASAIYEDKVSKEFADEAIKSIFLAVTTLNGQSVENATYSLIPDVIETKTLEDNGYQLVSKNGVTRFMTVTNKKLDLVSGVDVYIKEAELQIVKDVLKSKLLDKLIEKPGIVLEKTVSYSKNLVFIIYEKGELTSRSYNSLFSLLSVLLTNSKVEHIKKNYPTITHAGTLTLSGVTISLNEKIDEGNVHYYKMPEGYQYMVVRVNIDEIER